MNFRFKEINKASSVSNRHSLTHSLSSFWSYFPFRSAFPLQVLRLLHAILLLPQLTPSTAVHLEMRCEVPLTGPEQPFCRKRYPYPLRWISWSESVTKEVRLGLIYVHFFCGHIFFLRYKIYVWNDFCKGEIVRIFKVDLATEGNNNSDCLRLASENLFSQKGIHAN